MRDGLELPRVGRWVVDARVYEEGEQVFVWVGAFDDARVAYRLGASLQGRLKLPFELHYDPGHPQSDLAWTKGLERSGPPTASVAPLPKPEAAPDPTPPTPQQPLQASGEQERPRSQRLSESPRGGQPSPATPVAAGSLTPP